MATNDDAEVCPLCLETLDITDLACQFCTCGYSMCLWCWHRIREDAAKQSLPARCPNCRTVYQQDRVKMESIDANLLEDTRRRKKEDRKRTAVSQPKTRRDLANVRVVQRNLVYAVGLAMEICYEDTLMGPEYFGAFGKMVKQMSVNRMGPYGSSVSRNGPTGSAYITFKRPEDAKRCIESVNGAVWGGKQVKACFGTTKYCNAFLKGVICNNPECLYLHDIAEDTDSYTKEETKSTKFINLTHAASMTRQPSQSPLTGTPPPPPPGQGRLQGAASGTLPRQFSFSQMSEASSGLPQISDGWDSAAPSWLGSPSTATSWLAKAASSHALPTTPPMPSAAPVPPSADEQEWPELGGSTSSMAQQAASLAQERPAAPSSSASQAVHANGKASSSAETSPSVGRPDSSRAIHNSAASESASKPAATASSSSPEQRLPATPTRASPPLHSPETPVSGQTTASGSPAGASQAAGHQQQQQQVPSSHSSQQATPSFPSNGLLGTDERQQAGTQLQAQSQGRPAVSNAVQRDPVVQLVSRRSSGRVPPPGFSGPVAAPCTTSESASHAARHKGPPPGFGPAAQPSNCNAPPGFPSHSGSDSSDHQGHSWSVSQAAPQQWASFHPSHSSPNAAGSDHSTHGLHQSHSAGLAGYPCQPFAMPGLSDLQNLREQSGSEHSLFSGSSNQPGLAQSQFRQRSRFQFAQDPPMGLGSLADGPTSPSMYSSLMSPAVQQKDDQHDQNNAQLQHDHQRHQSGHQLFPPSGPGFASASLFASSPGGASASRQPGMHSVASSQGDGFVHAAACVMDHSGSNGHEIAPGQALLRQLQMSSALSSPQRSQHHQMWPEQSSAAAPGSGWDAYPAHSTSPFFDPAIVNASSAALRETGPALETAAFMTATPTIVSAVVPTHSNNCNSRPMLHQVSKPAPDPAGSAAAPVQMPLPPTLSPSQATAASAPQAAHGQAEASEAGNRDSDASAPTPGLQTPPKNGKRRRGGRGTKSGAAHRSPQTRGRGRGANAGQPSNADLALLQQQYDQAKSQLAISGAQLAQAQEKFQNIHI